VFITPLPTAGNASITDNQAPTSSSGPTWGDDFSDISSQAYRTRTLFFSIMYEQYAYFIPEGDVRSLLVTGPISLCLDSFLCMSVFCASVYIV